MSKIEILLAVSDAPTEELTALKEIRARGTCESLLETTELRQWLFRDPSPSINWMHAHPGSGKSVKASFLIDSLKTDGRVCHYYFFKYQDSTKRSLNSLLRSLAYQIAKDIRPFQVKLAKIADEGLRHEKTDGRALWHTLFEGALFKINLQHPIYWVIDALDESDTARSVIECLAGIPANVPVYVIILSRNMSPISTAFDRAGAKIKVNTLCIDDNAEDIRKYAEKEIKYMHGALDFRQRITEAVVERAEGNFLWAHLALQEVMQSHSEEDCWAALEEIPSGMEPLYQRMEKGISQLSKPSDRSLARLLLIWVTYSRRPLTIEELLRALHPEYSRILDLPYTINQVCGQFVVVDSNRRLSLIHKTAREFLTQTSNLPFSLNPQDSHRELFERSITVFLDLKIHETMSIKHLASFHLYAATSWAYHLGHVPPELEDPLGLLVKFFSGSYVLYWIEVLAISDQVKTLISTSQSLSSYIRRRRKVDSLKAPPQRRITDLETLDLWTTDLLKLVGKFGSRLRQDSTVIHKFIPQLSPPNSALHQQFASASSLISVTGLSITDWDDLLSRVSIGTSDQALMITCSSRTMAVLTSAGTAILFDILTFEKVNTFSHQEYCFTMCFDRTGDQLATYGFRTTKVWDVRSGHLTATISNPPKARAMDICFTEHNSVLLMLTERREAWSLDLQSIEGEWQTFHAGIFEEGAHIESANTNSPTSFQFNSIASQVVIGYRGSPVEVWDLSFPPELINRCRRRQNQINKSKTTWTGTMRTRWHPHDGEILGIYCDGAVFKWHPVTENHIELAGDLNSAPSEIQCSPDGLVFATSDVKGVVKLYSYEYFSMIYQLSSEDTVTSLCFSPDSRRFYDIRGSYCNIWEPNALIRLSDADERIGDTESEVGSSTDVSQYASESWVDTSSLITTLAVQPSGFLVCAGTEDGTVFVQDLPSGIRVDVASSAIEMSVEHLSWNTNGKYVAYIDLSRRLIVKEINTKRGKQEETFSSHRTILGTKLDIGAAQQLVFNFDSSHLLVANLQHAQIWSIHAKSIRATHRLSGEHTGSIWTNHPTNPEILLLFSSTSVTAHDWADFTKTSDWKLETSQKVGHIFEDGKTSESRPGFPKAVSGSGLKTNRLQSETLTKVELSYSKEFFLLFFAKSDASHQSVGNLSKLLLLPVTSLQPTATTIDNVITIPSDILNIIERPLTIIGRDRLVFIDKSFWVCTWRVDISKPASASVSSTAEAASADNKVASSTKTPERLSVATTSVETRSSSSSNNNSRRRSFVAPPSRLVQHFFLPQDWVSADVLRLCQVTADGTFLCPRRGEVAVIKSGLGSAW